MFRYPQRRTRIIISVVLALLLLSVATAFKMRAREMRPAQTTRLSKLPPLILWAWERPERLFFVDKSKASVAFLGQTLYLRGDTVNVRPRLQPLEVQSDLPLIAVARIESDRRDPPSLTESQMKEATTAIAKLSELSRVVGIQVDFDATLSERSFYRDLIFDLRKQLPESTALTITALASWCQGDNWLDDLPIDEAVPMLFRMGVEQKQFQSQIASGARFKSSKCQTSVGISTDEPIANLPVTDRLYVFNPSGWSKESFDNLSRMR